MTLAFRLPIFSVHRAHEGRRSLLKSDIQFHAVGAHIARGVFIGMPVLGRGAALMEKRRRAGRAVQKLRLVRREHDGLIRVRRGKRDDADVVEETVEAVRLQKLARQVRVDVLGVVRRLQDERLAVDISHAREAIDLHARLKALERHDLGRWRDDREVDQRGRRRFAQLGNFRRERILHALAARVRVGDERALAALAHDKALFFERADGLTDRVAADIVNAAELGLARQQVADLERAGGDAALDDAHELGIERNFAVERQRIFEDRIVFHGGNLPRNTFWNIPIIPHIFEMFQYFFPPAAEKPQKKEGVAPPF